MPDDTQNSNLREIANVLVRHGVEFIVIGGQAESLFGSPRVTYDVDVCHRRSAVNLERLAAALRELNVTLRGAPPDLPFQIDARSLALGGNFTFNTQFVAFDILGYVEPLGDYAALEKNAETYPVGNLQLKVISLDDLIRVKQHIGRSKDRESLLQLLAIKRIREETGMR